MNFMPINYLIIKATMRCRSKYSYPHFVDEEIENAKEQLAADWSADPQ